MNKNVEKAHSKLFYAFVGAFQNNGEDKLILHEVTEHGDFSYGNGNTLIVDPSSVTRFDKETP